MIVKAKAAELMFQLFKYRLYAVEIEPHFTIALIAKRNIRKIETIKEIHPVKIGPFYLKDLYKE